MKDTLKKFLPHLLIVILFIIAGSIYFYPVLMGKNMFQNDVVQATGMAKEVVDYEKQTGEQSHWTNSGFGGMPTYQIKGVETFNVHLSLQRFLRLALPYKTIAIFFIYLLGFYILLLSLDFKRWLAVLGALAFALSSYNIIIIEAGHITKAYAIGYMAPVIAGTIMLYNKKYLWGGLLTAFALGIQISTNHPQIAYYLGFAVGLYILYKLIESIVQKQLPSFAKASGVFLIAVVFAVLPNITSLWTTYEYGKYSTRGKSELTQKKKDTGGLDKDYALDWSYGIGETFTLMIPNFKGGATGALSQNETAMKAVKSNMKEQVGGQNQYWGPQPFTSGPVYVGAIIFFLFVLGFFIVEHKIKWWILAATILSILLSWGKNLEWFTDLFFNYMPMYNKFRTVSMALVIASLTIPLFAMISLRKIIQEPKILKEKRNQFFIAFGLTGGLSLLFWIIPGLQDYITSQEMVQINQAKAESPQYVAQLNQILEGMESARISLFKADAIRSFFYILLTAAILYVYTHNKIKKEYILGILTVLLIFDMWIIDRRYLNEDNFEKKSQVKKHLATTTADDFILKDKDPNYRVLNLSRSVFNDGVTSNFHKSIGGYHGAKLKKYQELIEFQLSSEIQTIYGVLQQNPEKLNEVLKSLQVINMLNTKYIIYDPNSLPLINMSAYGNAWFVSNVELVESADQLIEKLGKSNLKATAIINKNKFSDYLNKLPKSEVFADDTSRIVLTNYAPNHIEYKSYNIRKRLAVFSEIYYPAGWNAYLDGQKIDHISANYVLRALVIPEGNHTIEFKFEPKTVSVATSLSIISSIILLLVTLGLIGWEIYKRYFKKKK